MHLEIITPETKVFVGEVVAVQFPGLDGSFQVLNDHAPIISGLAAGSIKVDLKNNYEEPEKAHPTISVEKNNKTLHISIKGGVVELQNNKIIVLAE